MATDDDIPEVRIRRFGGITSLVFEPGSEPRFKSVLTPPLGYHIVIPADFIDDGELAETTSWSQYRPDGTVTGASVFVNWVWLPQVPAAVQFDANLAQIRQNAESPRPQYRDIQVFDPALGYAWDGPAFWFKEVDKASDDDIHRWHIKAFGNDSQYTVGLTGTFGQFTELAPLYEEAVKRFARVPLSPR